MSSLGRIRTLILEDDAHVARAVERCLKVRGADATLAASCREAMATSEPFDVGVFDIELPDGDGIAVAQELMNQNRLGVVVFFSGLDDPEVVRRALKIGPFVHKGDGAEALVQALGTALTAELQAAVGDETSSRRRRRWATSGVRRRVPR